MIVTLQLLDSSDHVVALNNDADSDQVRLESTLAVDSFR
jgi:hypothetical protein